MSKEFQSDVLIVGAGPTGLFAALLLSQLNVSVRIIDRAQTSGATNSAFLWSPRSLQLLQQFDPTGKINDLGVRHWRFETYVHKGNGSSAVLVERQQHRVWENESTEFGWSLSCECDRVCQVLLDALELRGIQVHYGHRLLNMEDATADEDEGRYYKNEKYESDANKIVIATIHDSKENYSYDWKARAVIGADGAKSFVRQKLGLALEQRRTSSVFYTLEAAVNTNFPGTRTISTVVKNQNALFIVGHKDRMYFIFEHNPKWSKLTIDDDVPLAMAQRHIKSIMEPNQIEFVKVHRYHKWSGDSKTCESYSVDRRYFLVGAAAQTIYPEGLLMGDVALEQANNLCWKLFLHLRSRASPMLIDTYETESKSKVANMLEVSHTLLYLISSHRPPVGAGHKSTLTKELSYHLSKNKHALVGDTPYHSNIINQGTESMLSFSSSTETIKAALTPLESRYQQERPGTPGTVALNAKLKPYTLFQLLVIHTSKSEDKTAAESPNNNNPASQRTSRKNGISGSKKQRARSNSETSVVGHSWFTPFLQSVTRRNSGTGRKSPDPPNTTTTPAATAAVLYLERWRGIKPTYYQLLDRMSQNKSSATFTILIFCGSLTDRDNLTVLQRLKQRLESPNSFMQRYETVIKDQSRYVNTNAALASSLWLNQDNNTGASQQPSVDQARNSLSSSHRSSVSTIFSASSLFQSTSTTFGGVGRSSMDQVRPSYESSVLTETSIRSASMTQPLFAFIYITSSSKSEANKFLANTKPSLVHALFPYGLDKVYVDHDGQSHKVYAIQKPTAVIIRPDGYIGARASLVVDSDMAKLDQYFESFLRPAVDMSSAAALAADYYCY